MFTMFVKSGGGGSMGTCGRGNRSRWKKSERSGGHDRETDSIRS